MPSLTALAPFVDTLANVLVVSVSAYWALYLYRTRRTGEGKLEIACTVEQHTLSPTRTLFSVQTAYRNTGDVLIEADPRDPDNTLTVRCLPSGDMLRVGAVPVAELELLCPPIPAFSEMERVGPSDAHLLFEPGTTSSFHTCFVSDRRTLVLTVLLTDTRGYCYSTQRILTP